MSRSSFLVQANILLGMNLFLIWVDFHGRILNQEINKIPWIYIQKNKFQLFLLLQIIFYFMIIGLAQYQDPQIQINYFFMPQLQMVIQDLVFPIGIVPLGPQMLQQYFSRWVLKIFHGIYTGKIGMNYLLSIL